MSFFIATRGTPFLVDTLVSPLRYTNKTYNFAHRVVVTMTKHNSNSDKLLDLLPLIAIFPYFKTTYPLHVTAINTEKQSRLSLLHYTSTTHLYVNIIKPSCYRSRGINSLSCRLMQDWKYFLQNAIIYNHEN